MHKIKITLMDTTPPVWRMILVDSSITLNKLHHMIQAAMGWENSHMHEFHIGKKRYGLPMDDEFDTGVDVIDALGHTVQKVLKKGTVCLYTYDFGDDWCHRIEVEDVAPSFGRYKAPACIDGARRCPPEDSGGVYHYETLLEAAVDPDSAEHESIREWLGLDADEVYDTEHFSKESATKYMRSKFWQNMAY